MLPPERWQLVERIFHEAAERPAGQRAVFLESSCGGDAELKREVVSLLDADSPDTLAGESLAAQVAADWAAASRGEPMIGREIDGYRVIELLGAGGMGETYLAEDSSLGRRVALKLLPAAFGGDSGRVRRFIDEARSASALSHPGIVTVYGAGLFEGQRYIATEFIDGATLREKLTDGPLPAAEALDIAIQAAAALDAAHDAGIVHRDIKPENIMIRRRDGYLKIIDFGLAKLSRKSGPDSEPGSAKDSETDSAGESPARAATQAGGIVGTIDYMAPEQASGGLVDARADLYSLTVVICEMLTGALPRQLGTGAPAGETRKLPSSALRLIHRGVASDPARRFQTARELRRELETLRTLMVRRTRPRPLSVGIGALAVLSAVFGVYRWAWHSTNDVRSLAVMPLRSFGASDQAHLEQGMTEAIVARLSGLRQLRIPPAAAIRGNEDPFEAARRLGVDAVLTGSLQREGDRLRVTAQLSRASDRRQIWAQQYDEKFTDIFAIEDAIAGRVATSLVTDISLRDRATLTRRETRNPDAYDLYLRARDQWALRTAATVRTSIRMYQQAIAIQADFALAYAGLADSYNLAVSGIAPLTRAPLAKAAAERALALDPLSAEAHTALAFQDYKFEWKWKEADREFRRAIELNPRYTLAHHWYGEFLKLLMRHDESIREFRKAMELDPFSIPVHYDFVLSLLNAGRVAEARIVANEMIAIDPNAERVLTAQADVLAAEGRPAESEEFALRSLLVAGESEAEVDPLRSAFRTGGERAVYRKRLEVMLARTKPGEPRPPWFATSLADLYIRLKDRNKTLYWLKKATDLHEDEPLVMKTHLYDFLRRDPEFIALEKRVGLLP